MTTRTTIVVVGGGLIGTWTALLLARRGSDVTLIEKGVVGAQSSGVNFGNLRLQGRHPGQYPLSLRSQALWENIDELIGDRCEFERTGHLYVAMNDTEQEKLEQHARVAESHGLVIERIDRDQLRRRWPWVGESPQAATYSARDATANPRLVSAAVARAAQRLGAEVLENTHVTQVHRNGTGFAVTTDTGRVFDCDAVVNSAGAWALNIAEAFGETAPMFAAGPPQFVTEPLPYQNRTVRAGGGWIRDLSADSARQRDFRRLSANRGRSRAQPRSRAAGQDAERHAQSHDDRARS